MFLFTSEELNTTGVIWGIAFKKDLRMHFGSPGNYSQPHLGANWSFVMPFVDKTNIENILIQHDPS